MQSHPLIFCITFCISIGLIFFPLNPQYTFRSVPHSDKANAYLNGNLVADSFYDGTDWILSLSRLKGTIETNPLVLRIDGLKSADANIYFEKNVNPEKCVTPTLDAIKVKQEYRFRFNR